MNRLILLRHGKAEGHSPSGEDFDRALAERGVAEAAAMGRLLASHGLIPDLALVSSAIRTRETWDAVQPAFPKARVEFARSLYEAPARVIRAMAELADGQAILVVGHNPGMQELAVRLLAECGAGEATTRARHHFPPATAAAFDFDPKGRPDFQGLFYPEGRG